VAIARLDIAYDGSRFSGWSAQPGQRTVQGELESGLERILRQQIELTVAGRTDSGVHATGQVASFEYNGELPEQLAERLNAVLPHDVAVRAVRPAPDGFDARHSALARVYRYRLLVSTVRNPFEERRALWWRYPLDRDLLDAAAAAVIGKHDFTAFTPTQTEHVLFERNVDVCEWTDESSVILVLRIEAKSFMRNQVRVLVGTMLEVGGGRRALDDLQALLEGAERSAAGETAPPHGLYLTEVRY
jgi:tRNA pseudouridine38-40 synthase